MTTTTSPSRWVGDDGKGHVPSATAQSSEAGPHSLDVFALDSCHSTWIFDPRRLRFRRILKGVAFKGRPVFTQWRPYSQLQLDFEGEGFTVYLNPARTRLIRSWRHTRDCSQCGGSASTVLPLEDVLYSIHGHRNPVAERRPPE